MAPHEAEIQGRRHAYGEWYLWAVKTVVAREPVNGQNKDALHGVVIAVLAGLAGGLSRDHAVSEAIWKYKSARDQLRASAGQADPDDRLYAEWLAWACLVEAADAETGHRIASMVTAGLSEGRSPDEMMKMARGMILKPDELRLVRAAWLSRHLAGGGSLPEISNPYFHAQQGERLIASTQGNRQQFFGTQETYQGAWVWAGGPLLGLATLGASALYNSAQRRAAEARAKESWRLLDQGVLHLTTARLAFQGQRQWFDVWFQQVRASNLLFDCIEIAVDEYVPLRFQILDPEYHFVLFRYLSQGWCEPFSLPPELEEKARNAIG